MDRDFSTNPAGGTTRPGGLQGDPLRDQVRDTARDVRNTTREGLDEGRRAANEVIEDVQEKGRRFAQKAKVWGNRAKEQSLRVARDVGDYAQDNTAIVAVAMLAVGVLIGRYLVPTSD